MDLLEKGHYSSYYSGLEIQKHLISGSLLRLQSRCQLGWEDALLR